MQKKKGIRNLWIRTHSLVLARKLRLQRDPIPGKTSHCGFVQHRNIELREAHDVGPVKQGLKSVQLNITYQHQSSLGNQKKEEDEKAFKTR